MKDLGEIMWAEQAEGLRKPALLWRFVFVTSKRQTQGHSQRIRWQSRVDMKPSAYVPIPIHLTLLNMVGPVQKP